MGHRPTAVGGIQGYAGVDVANPINAEAGQTTASGLAHAAPTITTTVANTMLVGNYTISSSTTFTPQDPDGAGALLAMTESFDTFFSPGGATGQTLEGTRIVQPAAGATPVYISNAFAQADFGNTHLLALRPQPTDQIDIPKPAAAAENDILIAAIGFRPNTLTITPPAGWTLVQRLDNAAGTANSLAVYRRLITISEPGAYQWAFSGGALGGAVGGIQAFRGVDPVNPVDASGGQNTVSGTVHATPSVTTTVTNAMLVTAHTFGSSAVWGAPGGLNETYDRASLTVPNAEGQSIIGAYGLQAIAGATGAKSATAGAGNPDTGNTLILALRPAATGGARIHYVHADHLNTPRAIFNQTQQLVWRWDNTEPFGNSLPDENPSGLGNFACNLRYPGQYFDNETNLHYNYFRDYDPAIGRYIESDPIGLEGGVNTYGYVGQNPITRDDPLGTIWQPPLLFCARFPRICASMADCFKRPAECRGRFCRAGNRLYHPLCDFPGCVPGESCATVSFKLGLAEGCYANRLAVGWFCFGGKPDANHERERGIAWQKAQDCLRVFSTSCGC